MGNNYFVFKQNKIQIINRYYYYSLLNILFLKSKKIARGTIPKNSFRWIEEAMEFYLINLYLIIGLRCLL